MTTSRAVRHGRQFFKRPLVQQDAKDDGNRTASWAVATFDFDDDGGATGDHGLGVEIPANAVIVGGFVDVLTTFASPTADTATIGIEAGTADLVAAVDIADVGNPWDAGLQDVIPARTAATNIKVGTSPVEIIVDIGVEDITAGKFIVGVEYTISGS